MLSCRIFAELRRKGVASAPCINMHIKLDTDQAVVMLPAWTTAIISRLIPLAMCYENTLCTLCIMLPYHDHLLKGWQTHFVQTALPGFVLLSCKSSLTPGCKGCQSGLQLVITVQVRQSVRYQGCTGGFRCRPSGQSKVACVCRTNLVLRAVLQVIEFCWCKLAHLKACSGRL